MLLKTYDKTNQKNKRYHSPKDKKNPGVIPGDPEGLIAYSREAMISKKDNWRTYRNRTKTPSMADNGWLWLTTVDNGWQWLTMADNGWET